MPQRVLCKKCGSTIYEGDELKPPYELIRVNDGKCPTCGNKLSHIPIDFEIELIENK